MPLSRSCSWRAFVALVCLLVVGTRGFWPFDDSTTITSNLPFVVVRMDSKSEVNPDYQNNYVNAWMEVIGTVGGNNKIHLPYTPNTKQQYKIGIHVRGQSTREDAKKPFTLKVYDPTSKTNDTLKVSLLGFGEQDKYILYASGADPSLVRNQLSFNLHASMGHFAPRMKYVELFVAKTNSSKVTSDDYRGVYMLSESIHRGKEWVNIKKMEEDDNSGKSVTGGYIFKVDKWDKGEFNNNTIIYTNYTAYTVTEPDDDVFNTPKYLYLEGCLEKMEKAIMSKSGYTDLIDRLSFVDMVIIQELSKNNDAYRLSQYFYKDREGKIVSGPVWDLDRTYGNELWNSQLGSSKGWIFSDTSIPDLLAIPKYWPALLSDPEFTNVLKARWNQLRAGPLSTHTVLSRIDEYHFILNAKGAADRDYKIWGPWWFTFDIFYNGNFNDYTTGIVKEWVQLRLEWMDTAITSLL